jgi:TPR repeat protein
VRDYAEAAKYFKLGAKQQNALSLQSLQSCYTRGLGVAANADLGRYYSRMASRFLNNDFRLVQRPLAPRDDTK